MNIGIDAGALGISDNRLRVGSYQLAKNLIIELSKLDKVNQYYLFSFHKISKEILDQLGANFKNITFKPARGYFQFRLPIEFILKHIDLFLALNQALPWFHPFKTITFVHDLAFEHLPACYPDSYISLVLNTKHAIYNSNKIIVPSKTVAKDLINRYHVREDRVKVIYEGTVKLRPSTVSFKEFQPYFLYVGAFKRIKNIPRMIKAFSLFKKQDKNNFKLIMAGSDYWIDPNIIKIINDENLGKDIINLQFIDDENLANLYKSAYAFLSPSLYEGFGLTSLEAMVNNCPVIVGNKGASPEIVDKAGIIVDSENVNSIYRGIEKLANDINLRKQLVIDGKNRAKEFSWQKFAKEFYQEIKSI